MCELCVHGAVEPKRFGIGSRDKQVFTDGFAAGRHWRSSDRRQHYIIGDPLKLRVELEPPSFDSEKTQELQEALFGLFRYREDEIEKEVGYRTFTLEPKPNSTLSPDAVLLQRTLRYFRSFRILPQKWLWYGRPVPSLGDSYLISSRLVPTSLEWEQTAFAGRPNDVVGAGLTGRLARTRLPRHPLNQNPLYKHDVEYDGTPQYWRFRLEMDSRYASRSGADRSLQARANHVWKPTLIIGSKSKGPQSAAGI